MLGDVVANGVIDTADVTFISRIVNEEIKLETLSIEQQLETMSIVYLDISTLFSYIPHKLL